MKLITHPIEFAGEELWLTNQRVLYWPKKEILILSDVHLGKAAHFRKHGIAIPKTVSDSDLDRLQGIIEHFAPNRIFFVGDLFHAQNNQEVQEFVHLTQKYPDTEMVLIEGNHDRLSTAQLRELGIHQKVKNWFVAPIHFAHEPSNSAQVPTICGHKHPGIRLLMPHKKTMRLPCFAVSHNQIILPAFSRFTGLDTQLDQEEMCFFTFDENGVYGI